MDGSGTARQLARAATAARITDVARSQLAEVGASGLSLRAVAREMGLASSALYRYFPHRDALLTALIIDAYDALGAAGERSYAAAARDVLMPPRQPVPKVPLVTAQVLAIAGPALPSRSRT